MKLALRCSMLPVLALIALPSLAIADDVEPADYRGEPNTVMAKFDLLGPPSLDSITFGANATFPLSTVQAGIVQDPALPLYQVTLPNYIDDLPLKKMRLQYSWFGQGGDAVLRTVQAVPQTNNIFLVDSIPPMPVPGVPNAFYRWDDIEIYPNPDFEVFQVEILNADPRWIVVDTISTIPEPASLALAALGLGMLLHFRRRP